VLPQLLIHLLKDGELEGLLEQTRAKDKGIEDMWW